MAKKRDAEPSDPPGSQCMPWKVIELRDGWWLCHTLPIAMQKKWNGRPKRKKNASSNRMSNRWPTKEWNELKDGNAAWMVCTITTFYRCVACLNLIYLCLGQDIDLLLWRERFLYVVSVLFFFSFSMRQFIVLYIVMGIDGRDFLVDRDIDYQLKTTISANFCFFFFLRGQRWNSS